MKNLTILLLLFTVFAFGDWDVDPDYSTLTVDSLNAGKVVVDDTIFTDFIAPNDLSVIEFTNTVKFASGTMELDDVQPATNDSSSSQIGASNNPYGNSYIVDGYIDTVTIKNKLVTPDSVRFVEMISVFYTGGVNTITSTETYYVSNSVDEDMYSYGLPLAYLKAEGNAVVDSVFLNYYTQGTEDSIKVILQTTQNGARTKVDSTAWLFGATGWRQTPTIIPNGDITVTDNTIFDVWIDCDNDGTADIKVDLFVRFVYHLE